MSKDKPLEWSSVNIFYRWREISKGKYEVADKAELKADGCDVIEDTLKKCFLEKTFLSSTD